MNVNFVVADQSGKIKRWGHCPEDDLGLQEHDDEQVVQGEGMPSSHYVADGAIVARQANPASLEGTTLSNLPVPCKITVAGQTFDCSDDTANMTLPVGVYQVKVSAWPFLDANFEVRV